MEFKSFKDFYPYYLGEHSNKTCRCLHFLGTTLLIALLGYSLINQNYNYLWFLPVIGYGFAWVGHFVFEKNRPATFKHPLYSLMGDFKMFWDILRNRKIMFN